MTWNIIIQAIVLNIFVSGIIIAALYMVLIKTVDGAKQRLEREAQAHREREAELSAKVKEADDELQRRKREIDALEQKLKGEIEEEAQKEKEEIIGNARKEAEDIITRAQDASDKIRKSIELDMELKIIDYSQKILNDVLSETARGDLNKALVREFVQKLQNVDMSRIGVDVAAADFISAESVDASIVADVKKILKDKLGRDVAVTPKTDPSIIAGVMLQFGSLLLDGSLQDAIKQSAVELKQETEKV